jgi:hypothetical protein
LVEVVPATADELRVLMGGKITATSYAFVVRQNGRVTGALGLYPHSRRWVLFGAIPDQTRVEPSVALRRGYLVAMRKLMKVASRRAMPIHSSADPHVPNADVPLEHAGFRHLGAGLWEYR